LNRHRHSGQRHQHPAPLSRARCLRAAPSRSAARAAIAAGPAPARGRAARSPKKAAAAPTAGAPLANRHMHLPAPRVAACWCGVAPAAETCSLAAASRQPPVSPGGGKAPHTWGLQAKHGYTVLCTQCCAHNAVRNAVQLLVAAAHAAKDSGTDGDASIGDLTCRQAVKGSSSALTASATAAGAVACIKINVPLLRPRGYQGTHCASRARRCAQASGL
jgi:hypothetical protein